jgi:heptosyltransferase-2
LILATPLIQAARDCFPAAKIDFLTTPLCANLIEGNPALNRILIFDKHRRDRGLKRLYQFARSLKYDLALIPHRSLRSSLLAWLAGIPHRIGFDTSSGAFLFTQKIHYSKESHEIDRNLALLRPFCNRPFNLPPIVVPDSHDEKVFDALLAGCAPASKMFALAPGSVWETKRWPAVRFFELSQLLLRDWNCYLFFIGGKDEFELCQNITEPLPEKSRVFNLAGKFTFRQSAEVIRRCDALISNDSAPLHLGVAVDTPVFAIFGPTVPAFGFAPRGEKHQVIEKDIYCRPCAIHGGRQCPTGTFLCMKSITPNEILDHIKQKFTRV